MVRGSSAYGPMCMIWMQSPSWKLSNRVLDRAGFTKAGRGLMKHGYREGSVFPKPVGMTHNIFFSIALAKIVC